MPSGNTGDRNVFITNISKYVADKLATALASLGIDITKMGGETVVADNGAGAAVTKTLPVGGKYNATPPTYTDGDVVMSQYDVNGQLKVAISSDIEIGAVELKNAATDDRALISDANTARAATDHVIAVQQIDASGTVSPSGSTAGNAPFTKITDGTNSAAILARTTGTEQPAVTDDALIVYDVGGGAASVTSKYRATTSDKGDGTAVYASGTTLTLAGTPFTIASEDLVYIREVDATANTANIWVNGTGGVHMEITAGTLTKSGGTNFSANGAYEVGYNGSDKAYDNSLDVIKTIEQSPLHSRYTSVSADMLSATPYELTASFADVGAEIGVGGYNYLTLWLTIDIGTSTDVQIRILHKHTSAGSEEYREIYLGNPGTPTANVTTINLNDYEINSDSDQLFKITLPVTGSRYIQVQAKDAANGDGQIDTLYYTLDWGA